MIPTDAAYHMSIVSFLFGGGLALFCVWVWCLMRAAGEADRKAERIRAQREAMARAAGR